MDVYLVRHTTVAVAAGLCYGRTEVCLADSFEQDSAQVVAGLPDFDRIYTSPSERCLRLAERLEGPAPESDSRLLELDFGEWEGHRWDDLDGPELRAWGNDYVDTPCPGGESYAQLAERAAQWQRDVPVIEGRIAVVSHGGTLRALLATWLDLSLEQAFRFSIDCGGVTLLRPVAGKWTARFVNRHG